MEKPRVRVGVAGVGKLGSLHAEALSNHPDVHFVGVFDTSETARAAAVERFGSDAFDALGDLLERCEAVVVAVPTIFHHETALACLARDRHILVEKPIADSVAAAEEIVAAARKRGLVLHVGHIERFNPAFTALGEATLQPMFIESHRLARFIPRGTDVAVVLDLMIHDLDIILRLVDSPIARIDASGVSVVSREIDIANARLQFENGCVANITASRLSQRRMRRMRLFQHNAYISLDFLDGFAEVFRLAEQGSQQEGMTTVLGQVEEGERKVDILHEVRKDAGRDALSCEVDAFVQSVRGHVSDGVSGGEALKALKLALEIRQTIKQNNPDWS